MKTKKGFMLRKVGGMNVVVAVGKASEDFNGRRKSFAGRNFAGREWRRGFYEKEGRRFRVAWRGLAREAAGQVLR